MSNICPSNISHLYINSNGYLHNSLIENSPSIDSFSNWTTPLTVSALSSDKAFCSVTYALPPGILFESLYRLCLYKQVFIYVLKFNMYNYNQVYFKIRIAVLILKINREVSG